MVVYNVAIKFCQALGLGARLRQTSRVSIARSSDRSVDDDSFDGRGAGGDGEAVTENKDEDEVGRCWLNL